MTSSPSSIVLEAFANCNLVAEVIPFNLEAINCSLTVWEQRDKLPKSKTRYLYVRNTTKDNESDPHGQQLNAADLSSIHTQRGATEYPGFCLTTDNFELGKKALGWTLGPWMEGQGESGVSLLTNYPGEHVEGVQAPQAFIHIHNKSSMVVIRATNPEPIYVQENGEWVYVGRYRPRVLSHKSYVRVGDKVYKVVIPNYDLDKYQVYRCFLDGAFKSAGFADIHDGLHSLPRKEAFAMIGPYIRHGTIRKNGETWIRAGVNVDSGEAVAIKKIGFKRSTLDLAMEREVEALFAFPNTEYVIQAKEVRCENGHYLNSEHLEAQTKTVQTFCECQEVDFYSVTELAHGDIASQKWREASILVCVKILSDSLKGLKIMHDKDYTHGKITGRNILITKLKPTEVRLSNFTNTLKADSFREPDLAPIYLLPPEDFSGHYTKECDIYSLAMLFCSIAFPKSYEEQVDYSRPQTSAFKEKMATHLQEMANKTADLRPLANAIKRILSANPDERPTAAFVLSQIPVEISQMNYRDAGSLADEEPTRKKAKLREMSGSGSFKYQSTAGSATSDTKNWDDDVSGVESSAAPAMSTTPISDFNYGSEGGWSKVK